MSSKSSNRLFKNAVVFNVSSRIINVKISAVSLGLGVQALLDCISLGFGTAFCTGGIFAVEGENIH